MLIQDFLQHSAHSYPDKIAIMCADVHLTYKEVDERSSAMAVGLTNLGLNKGERVLILMDNGIEAVISIFAVLKAEGVFVLVNAGIKSDKLNYILKDSQASILLTQSTKQRGIKGALAPDVFALRHVLFVSYAGPNNAYPGLSDLKSDLDSGIHNWDCAEQGDYAEARLNRHTIDIDLANIIYTSGSTGKPKGVVCAHYNAVSVTKSINQCLGNTPDDIILNALPLAFDYGLYQIYLAFASGASLVLEKSFLYPYQIVQRLVQERVTGFPLVPTMAGMLLQMERLEQHDFSALRYITNTAAALPVAYIQKLRSLFPNTKIFSMYGLTECKRVTWLPPEYLDSKPTSVGLAIPNTEACVVDETGAELGPGEVGELLVRGSHVMQGYWNDPAATSRTFRPGRYRGETLLHTGDNFRKDEDGFLYFVSRRDDMIKTKGERVSPKEVEDVLYDLEGVSEAVVVPVPDELCGQVIKAVLVRENGSALSERGVLQFCAQKLESFMVPKIVEFWKSLPKTSNGKIDKRKVQETG